MGFEVANKMIGILGMTWVIMICLVANKADSFCKLLFTFRFFLTVTIQRQNWMLAVIDGGDNLCSTFTKYIIPIKYVRYDEVSDGALGKTRNNIFLIIKIVVFLIPDVALSCEKALVHA